MENNFTCETQTKNVGIELPKWLFVFLLTVVFLLGCGTGGGLQCQRQNKIITPPEKSTAQQIIDNLPANAEVTYKLDEGVRQAEKSAHGPGSNIQSDKSFWRGLSWFGLSANEAAAKDQGIIADGKGGTAIGSMHGYGLLEQLWVWFKGVVWSLLFGLSLSTTVLFIMLLFPVTAPIATGILRLIASFIPGIGSIVEIARGKKKEEVANTKLTQVVKGVQIVKNDLPTEEKDKFNSKLMATQDEATQQAVKKIKAENKL